MASIAPPVESTRVDRVHRPLSYDQWREILRDVPLPAAVVDLDAFDANTRLFADAVTKTGSRHTLRLATKSVRVPALTRRVLDHGSPFQGLMCYSASEAAFLADAGFDDLLIAYPTVQHSDLTLVRRVHETGRRIVLMIDSLEGAKAVSSAMKGIARPLELALDIDMSLRLLSGKVHLGVRRSPVRAVEQAVHLFEEVNKLRGVRLRAAMGYEAQVAGLADENPFKRRLKVLIKWIRSASRRRGAELRKSLAATLEARGLGLELFNGGGSGSVNFTTQEPWLTETTVGSGLLCSHLFSYFSNISPQPACFFALQVTRSSDAGFVTCAGGGYIASGEPGWDKTPVPYLPLGLELVPMEGCGEVQTPLRVPSSLRFGLGEPVLFRHAKAGELAEHFNSYYLVAGGKIVDEIPTYRGLGQCFLG